MDTSPFSKLSPELRKKIYEYSLQQSHPILVSTYSTSKNVTHEHVTSMHALALTQTCRAIRNECTTLFYATNTFTIALNEYYLLAQKLQAFADAIGPANAESISMIVLDLNALSVDSIESFGDVTRGLSYFLLSVANVQWLTTLWKCNFRVNFSLIDGHEANQDPESFDLDIDFANLGESFEKALSKTKPATTFEEHIFTTKIMVILTSLPCVLSTFITAFVRVGEPQDRISDEFKTSQEQVYKPLLHTFGKFAKEFRGERANGRGLLLLRAERLHAFCGLCPHDDSLRR